LGFSREDEREEYMARTSSSRDGGTNAAQNQNERTKKWSKAKCGVLTVESWDTGKQATNVHLMELRKGEVCYFVASHVYFIHVLFT
jgi:hypothetical protein